MSPASEVHLVELPLALLESNGVAESDGVAGWPYWAARFDSCQLTSPFGQERTACSAQIEALNSAPAMSFVSSILDGWPECGSSELTTWTLVGANVNSKWSSAYSADLATTPWPV